MEGLVEAIENAYDIAGNTRSLHSLDRIYAILGEELAAFDQNDIVIKEVMPT
jgi:hypothetical protein